MKKIIAGKKYNTDTAKKVGEYDRCWDGFSVRDFGWYQEELYRKRNGEYFLAGEGGAASKYAEAYGLNGSRSGEGIIPLTYDEAREWAEKHLDADEYEELFGAVEEEGDRQSLNLSLSEGVVALIKREAGKTGRTMSDVVQDAVVKLLAE